MRVFSSWFRRSPSPCSLHLIVAAGLLLLGAGRATAAVTPASGYIYNSLVLASTTQSCIATAPGGTFVGIGLGFTANAQAVVQVSESSQVRLVAFGFSSISDCAYDAANDILYIADNADSGDLPGAASGDTVFKVASATSASGLTAVGLELVAANSIAASAGIAVDSTGNVLVGDASGGGAGTVQKISAGPSQSTFASGFDFTGGVAFDPTDGSVLVSESTASFQSQIKRFDAAGSFLSTLAGPSFSFGSYDLAFSHDDLLLSTGSSSIAAFNAVGTQATFASGFSFATGVSVNSFSGRVEALDSFSFSASDRSLHRFTPVSKLVPGGNDSDAECIQEFYGVELVAAAVGEAARSAICVDGAACDADGKANDRCVFPVGLCFKVSDPRFPECAQSDVASVTVAAKPTPAEFAAFAQRIQTALPVASSSCFFSDGVTVPVKSTAAGKKAGKGAVKAKAENAAGRKDSDTVRLICQPAP